jgi:D-3-phosphoglycerate dehydrogenase
MGGEACGCFSLAMSSDLIVAVGPSSFGDPDPSPLQRLADAGVHVRSNPYRRKLTALETIDHLRGAHGLLAGLEPLNRDVLSAARDTLRAVARVGIGMSNVDMIAAREMGIHVSNTPDGPTDAVAEMTLAALLSIARRLDESNVALHQRQWRKSVGFGLSGTRVLIVGFGRIGRRVAELLLAFGSEVLVTDPAIDALPAGFEMCRIVSFAEGLAAADVVSLHASGDLQILGGAELAAMRAGAVLLNAARGTLVDELALADALRHGHLGGAWLDVFSEEPYSGGLCDVPQALLTPHAGTYTRQCRLAMEMQAVDNLLRDLGLST